MEAAPEAAPDAQVTRMNQLLDELQAHQSAARRTLLLLALLLIALVLLFGYGLYRAVSTNLSVAQLEPVVRERLDFHTPRLQRTATEAVTLAMPAYQRIGREKLQEITPELQDRLQEEFDRLPDAVRERLDERLTGMQERIETQAMAKIEERFGDIDPEKVETLANAFADRVLERGGGIQSDLEDRWSQQRDRVQNVLEKFDLPATDGLSDGDLQLKVIENAALLVVYLTRNPEELPQVPALGSLTAPTSDQEGESL